MEFRVTVCLEMYGDNNYPGLESKIDSGWVEIEKY